MSPANPSIKFIRSLQRRKARYQERAFVVEGFRAVGEALDADASLRSVMVREDIPPDRLDRRLLANPVRWVSPGVFQSISNVDLPQGILAVVDMPAIPEIELLMAVATLVLVVDGVRDPGNLGTLLRSAAGAGADAVIVAEDSVDPYNPKVVRAAMGAHFQVPIVQAEPATLDCLLSELQCVVIADAAGQAEYDTLDMTGSMAIVVGGEAFGPMGHVQHRDLRSARIPLKVNVESLNAGVAGSLLLFEAARQRRTAARKGT